MIKDAKTSSKVKIDPSLTKKYKGTILFKDKFEWAINHVKGRDIEKEIKLALEKERITKP